MDMPAAIFGTSESPSGTDSFTGMQELGRFPMDKFPLTVGVLCNGDPKDVRTWSGVPYFVLQELSRRFNEVRWVPTENPDWLELSRKLSVLSRRVTGRGFLPWATSRMARRNALLIDQHLRDQPVDVLLSITVDHQTAYLQTEIPLVHHSDTTFAAIEDYYPVFSDLWGWARQTGHELCQRSVSRSAASVYPSHWAATSAIERYGADPAKIHVVPYGASFHEPPDRELVLASDRRQRCQLLFIGVDWERKGGLQAYATLSDLRRRGIDANLVVVGCRPNLKVDTAHVTVHPFLDKQEPEQLALYQQLWLRSSFLCMPSRAETFGAVFAEAAAYGLPVIASLTGGVPDAVIQDETGILLPLDATGHDFATRVAEIWQTPGRYEQMVVAARDRFESTLNWSAWADAVTPLLVSAAAQRQQADLSSVS